MKFEFSGLKTGLLAVVGAGLLASCVVVEEGPRPLPPRPGPEPICTQQYDPVCGERGRDQQTFPNSCVARAEGYRIAYGGECRRGGGSNWDRPGRPGGGPGWDRPGRPGPDRPQFCTREYAPVCAVQGNRQQTFGNACEAEAAGWRTRRGGEC